MSADPPPRPAPVPAGLACPRCKGTGWRVRETRRRPGRLVRVRTCTACKLRVRTREVIEFTGLGGAAQGAA